MNALRIEDHEPPGAPIMSPTEPPAVAHETYTILCPDERPFVSSITVWVEPDTAHGSVEELADADIQVLLGLPGFTRLDREDIFLENGFFAEEVLFRWETDGQVLHMRRLYTLHDNRAYTLSLLFKDEAGQGCDPEGEAVLHSFDPPGRLSWE